MRRSLLLVLAVLAGGCDKRSPAAEQGAGNAASGENLAATSPDEVAPGAGAAPAARVAGAIDRSHAGTSTPDYGFADPAGKHVTLAAFRGRPVLVNLWATWCGPCVKELPTLDALAAREKDKLVVVTLSQDGDAGRAKAFLAGRGLPHLGAWTDPQTRWLPAVTATLPTTILYGADGKERWRATGDRDWTDATSAKAIAEG